MLTILLLQHFKNVLLPSGLHGSWWEIYSNSNWCNPVVICCISLAAIKIFFFCLFQHFDEDVSGHGFMFIMFGLCWASWINRLVSFAKLETFHSLYIQKLFNTFCYYPTGPWDSIHYLSNFPPLCCSDWIICIDVFNFTDTFLCHFLCYWDHMENFYN